jgi:hypothetical protein
MVGILTGDADIPHRMVGILTGDAVNATSYAADTAKISPRPIKR